MRRGQGPSVEMSPALGADSDGKDVGGWEAKEEEEEENKEQGWTDEHPLEVSEEGREEPEHNNNTDLETNLADLATNLTWEQARQVLDQKEFDIAGATSIMLQHSHH